MAGESMSSWCGLSDLDNNQYYDACMCQHACCLHLSALEVITCEVFQSFMFTWTKLHCGILLVIKRNRKYLFSVCVLSHFKMICFCRLILCRSNILCIVHSTFTPHMATFHKTKSIMPNLFLEDGLRHSIFSISIHAHICRNK